MKTFQMKGDGLVNIKFQDPSIDGESLVEQQIALKKNDLVLILRPCDLVDQCTESGT